MDSDVGRETPGLPVIDIDAMRRHLAARCGREVQCIETHISWVLLDGEHAWKLKKPVQLGFVDFSTLAARRHFCNEELRLNRRLAPQLYLGVVPVRGTPDAPLLGGDGEAIEVALQMRQFAADALLGQQLAAGTLTAAHIDHLAARLAAFHAAAPEADAHGPWGTPAAVAESFVATLDRLAARGAEVQALRRWFDAVVPSLAPLWQQRLADGHVREGHGDLHLDNLIVLDDGGVTAFDCIEFDPALRWIDMQSDIAFTVMDLLAHRRADLAWRFLNAWLDATGDHAGLPVLRSCLVQRALVRALVARIRAGQGAASDATAPDYLALAHELAVERPEPRLVITHGLAGSGKSRLAQQLLERSGALRLRADVERKRLFGLAPLEVSSGAQRGRLYGAQANQRTYAHLLGLARTALTAGWPVIVDAAFLRRAERDAFGALADELGVPFQVIDCQAAPDVLRQRVRERSARGDDASEADEAVLAQQFARDEPLMADELGRAIVVRTDAAVDLAALLMRMRRMGRTD